jgi:hypothetical protein
VKSEQHNHCSLEKRLEKPFTTLDSWKFPAEWTRNSGASSSRTESEGADALPDREPLSNQSRPLSRVDSCRGSTGCAGDFPPNLHLVCITIRSRSGFSDDQWLCCSLFAPSAHSWPENLLTLHAYYQVALIQPRERGGKRLAQRYRQRTPAMAAGRTNRRWSSCEVLSYPFPPVSA